MDLKQYPLHFCSTCIHPGQRDGASCVGISYNGFLQWAHLFFESALLSTFFVFFSFLWCDLDCLSYLWLRSCGLRSSSDSLLLEVALYVDLVYSELESYLSIIE